MVPHIPKTPAAHPVASAVPDLDPKPSAIRTAEADQPSAATSHSHSDGKDIQTETVGISEIHLEGSGGPRPLQLMGAALLAAGRPLKLSELTELTGLSEDAALRMVGDIQRHLTPLGLAVEAVAGGWRLYVPAELGALLAPALAPPPLPPLSQAALEVLAVVAYRQPVTRAEIEAMRGGSASSLLTLQERELVRAVGRSDAVGHPVLYGTTQKFLMDFGLASLEDLPALESSDFAELLRG